MRGVPLSAATYLPVKAKFVNMTTRRTSVNETMSRSHIIFFFFLYLRGDPEYFEDDEM